MPLPSTLVWSLFFVGMLGACLIPLVRKFPTVMEGQIAQVIAEYDLKVVTFAHRAERVMLCSPGGRLGKASDETQEAFKEGDLDNNGSLSADEISFGLKKFKVEGITLAMSLAMLSGGDSDADGVLSKEEFHCVAGHAGSLYGKAVRALGSALVALSFVAFPPCAYYGFDLMHDEFGAGKYYKWTLVPLGILAAGVLYANSHGLEAVLPFVTMYAAVAIFLLSFYGLSGMLFVFYCFATTYKWTKPKKR